MDTDFYTKIFRTAPASVKNHYDLLGLKLFENSIQKIHDAAYLRFSELNKSKDDIDPETIQNMYISLSRAANTLEIPSRKHDYDRALARELGISHGVQQNQSTLNAPLMTLEKSDIATLEKAERDYRKKQKERLEKAEKNKAIIKKKKRPGEKQKETIPSPPPGKPSASTPVPDEKTISVNKCPVCRAEMSECAIICIECGYDVKNENFIETKKFEMSLSPGLFKRITRPLTDAAREGASVAKRIVKSTVTFISICLFLGAASFATYKIITFRNNFIIDTDGTIISSDWKEAIAKSSKWKEYFKAMRAKGEKPPFVKAKIKVSWRVDPAGNKIKFYKFNFVSHGKKSLELASGTLTIKNMAGLTAKLEQQQKDIVNTVDAAAEKALSR